MLGLGISLNAGEVVGDEFAGPTAISNLGLWLRHNTGVFADADSSESEIDHSTAAGNMADEDRISVWQDQSGNDNHTLDNNAFADRPLWEATGNYVRYASGKYLNLTRNITEAANSNFTYVFRGSFTNANTSNGLFGSSGTNFFRLSDNNTFRTKIGGATAVDYNHASSTLSNDVFYTVIITRHSGDGSIKIHVHGGSFDDEAWGTGTDGDEFVVNNVGCTADDTQNYIGNLKHAIYYSEALTDGERNNLQQWLEDND